MMSASGSSSGVASTSKSKTVAVAKISFYRIIVVASWHPGVRGENQEPGESFDCR